MYDAAQSLESSPVATNVKWVGCPQRRREDAALLLWQGRYVNDIQMPNCLHVVFVRGIQRGRITAIDVAEAQSQYGVIGVFTANDLGIAGNAAVNELITDLSPSPLIVLAVGQVHAVGQVVAAVIADTQHAAMSAAELVSISVEPGGSLPSGSYAQSWPGPHAAGGLTVSLRVQHARIAASAMEPRPTMAVWDEVAQHLTVWLPTQTPFRGKADLAAVLAAIVNAMVDALAPFGVRHLDMPLTPETL